MVSDRSRVKRRFGNSFATSVSAETKRDRSTLEGPVVNRAGNEFSSATELADELSRLGLPFRDAYQVVGKVVGLASLGMYRVFTKLELKIWSDQKILRYSPTEMWV